MNFIGILIGLMFSPFVLLFCKIALDVNIKKWQWLVLYVAWTASIAVPVIIFPHRFIRSTVIIICCFIAGMISGIGRKNVIYVTLNYLVTIMISDAASIGILFLFFDDAGGFLAESVNTDSLVGNFLTWCVYATVNIISCIIFSRKKGTIKTVEKPNIITFMKIVVFLWAYYLIYIWLFRNFFINLNGYATGILAVVPMISIMTVGFLIIDKRKKKKHIDEMLELQKNSIALYENSREFVHDYKNFLLYIQGAMENGDRKEVYKIVSEKLDDAQNVYNSSYKINLSEISDSGLRWLLVSKISESVRKSVSFEVRNVDDTDYIVKKSEFVEMLGILIDNAVEAAEESEKRRVVLDIKKTPCGYTMTIANTFKNAPDLLKIFDRDYSTKNGHYGIGLSRVKQITDKYEGVTLNVGIADGFFAMHIEGIKTL